MTFKALDIVDVAYGSSVIVIDKESDFPVQDATTITLNSGCYIQAEPMTITKRFVIPDNAVVEYRSSCLATNNIFYTGSNTLFTGSPLFFVLKNMVIVGDEDFTSFNSNATLFNLTQASFGGSIITINNVGFVSFVDLGTFTDISTINTDTVGWSDFGAGLKFDNVSEILMQGGRFSNGDSNVSSNDSGIKLIGTGNFDSVEIRNVFYLPLTGESFIFIDSGVTTTVGSMSGCNFSEANGGVFYGAGSVDQKDIQWDFRNNGTAEDSVVVGSMFFTGNALTTTINTINVYEDINGVAVAGNNLERFTFSDAPNELTYIGLRIEKGSALVSLTATDGSSGIIFEITLFQDTGSGFMAVTGGTILGEFDNRVKGVSFSVPITCETGDIFKVMLRNTEGTDNIVVNSFHLDMIK